MLGKLLKYEVRDTVKAFTPFYAIVLFLTLITTLAFKYVISSSEFNNNVFAEILLGTLSFVTVISFTVIVTMVSFFIVSRFYKNLIKTEGYFMHSLPVSSHLLILSKLISAIVLVVITIIFAILCAFIFVLIIGEIPIDEFLDGLWFVITEMIFTFTFWISLFNGILFVYASIAIGSLFSNKFLGGILAYIGYSTARSFITAIITSFIPATSDLVSLDIYEIEAFLSEAFFITNILSVVFIAISYIIVYYIFSQKLNLE